MYFDSHAHLDRRFWGDDVDAVVARALAAGVSGIVAIGCGADPAEMREAVDVAARHERVWAAVGVHPHEAGRATPESFEAVERLLSEPKVVALGEIGLDFHYDLSPRDVQRTVFRRQLELAAARGVPVSIHCREADEECLEILSGLKLGGRPGVIHCFDRGLEVARRYLDLGFVLSIPGIVTFPRKTEALQEAVRALPLDRMLVETDSPYLAPVPMRGKRDNEPAFVRYTVEAIARLRGLSVEDVARVTALNARRLFGIADADADRPRLCYAIRDSLYVNLTNRCTLHCVFCAKFRDWTVKGHNLRVGRDPTLEELRTALEAEDLGRYREVVFCGYGEPLLRLEEVKALADWAHARGMRTRVNTDGLASLVHGRDVSAELAGRLDVVSVSLNAPDAATYAANCRSSHGEGAFASVCDFIRAAKAVVPEVVATVVALPGLDLEACRRLAEGDLGVPLRVRPYNDLG